MQSGHRQQRFFLGFGGVLAAALLMGSAAFCLVGCQAMGIEEDPKDAAVRTGKKAKAMQEERYKRVDDATAILDGK
jgi:hypothetical protein